MPEATITQRRQKTRFTLIISSLKLVAFYPALLGLLLCRLVAERARGLIELSEKSKALSDTTKVQSAHVDKTFGEYDRFVSQWHQETVRIGKEKWALIDFSALKSLSAQDILKHIQLTRDDLYAFVWKYFLLVRFWLRVQEYNQLVDDITLLLNGQSVQNESLNDVYEPLQCQIKNDLTISMRVQIRKIMHACIGDQLATYQNRPIAQSLQALSLLPSEPALQAEKNYFQLKHQHVLHRYVYHDALQTLFNVLLMSKMYASDDALQTSMCPEDMETEMAYVLDQVSRFEKRSGVPSFWQEQSASWLQREQAEWHASSGFYTQFSLYEQAKGRFDQEKGRVDSVLLQHWNTYLLPIFKRMASLIGTMGQRMQQDRINMLPAVPLSKGQFFKLIPEKAARCIQTRWRAYAVQHAVQPVGMVQAHRGCSENKPNGMRLQDFIRSSVFTSRLKVASIRKKVV